MSSQQTPSNPNTGWSIERLVPYEQQIGYGLIAAGLLLAAIPIANAVMYRTNSLAILGWGVCLSVFVIGVGLYAIMPPAPGADIESRTERLRWILLLTAGGVGAMTALLGLILPFCTTPMALTNYPEIFKGGPKSWRSHGWEVGRCVAALIGGLVLMFVGLQLARPVQRTSMSMRRWLYGYNAILGSLLLLFTLVLVNLLPYTAVRPFSWAMEATDWTSGELYTLHTATRNLLTELKEPVKVYVLIPSGGLLARDVEILLNNCRAVNPLLTWEQMSRDRNRGEIARLIQEFQLPDSVGVLVVYGTKPNETSQFIKAEELAENASGPNSDKSYVFKGENALLNALTYLTSGKSRAIVYFTQGNGELDLNDQDRNHLDTGLGALQEELNKINYQTHPLNLGPKTTSIPEDADIVVLARPLEKLPDNAIKALRDYLQGTNRKDNKKGKLMVLFDVNVRKGEMVPTGLEPLMAEYGVKVGNDRVMCLRRDPLQLTTVANPRSSNAIARAFTSRGAATTLFLFYDARTVRPANAAGAPSRFTAEELIYVLPQRSEWVETDLKADPGALVEELSKDRQKLLNKLGERLLPLAVTVTEGKSAAPPVPGHEFMARDGEPRMVVFGDASWVTNRILLQATPDNFALFSSSLSWLVGRHDIGERIPTSTRSVYKLKVSPGDDLRLIFLPGVLMVMGVFALGFGVWVVRRR
jgi:hypothetical protein